MEHGNLTCKQDVSKMLGMGTRRREEEVAECMPRWREKKEEEKSKGRREKRRKEVREEEEGGPESSDYT